MTDSAVPLSGAVTVTVTVASSVTVMVACVQELGEATEAPASFRDAELDSIIVE